MFHQVEVKPALIFDLDGTLIDSVPDLLVAVNRMLADLNEPPMQRDEVQSYVGEGAPMLVSRVLAARGLPDDVSGRLTAAMVADYSAHAAIHTRPYPGVIAALSRLAEAGHPLGLCTNKPLTATEAVLNGLGLSHLFTVCIGGDSLPQRKPHPAPLLAAVRALGADRAVFVGDSQVDAETAERAALPFVLYTEGYLNAPVDTVRRAAVFSDFADLPEVLAALEMPAKPL
jgi:phosphoglycolate phosphatase